MVLLGAALAVAVGLAIGAMLLTIGDMRHAARAPVRRRRERPASWRLARHRWTDRAYSAVNRHERAAPKGGHC